MNQSTLSRVFAILLVFGLSSQTQAEQLKPRMLVLTDVSTWETDDHESLIRLMAHADLFEIEGIVISTGYSVKTLNKSPENGFIDIARGVVDAYEKDLPNLMKRSGQTGHAHDGGKQAIGYWPSAQYLRERIMLGSMNRGKKFIGDDNGSPGSELLITQADEEDDRPLWIGIWGGGNTLAQSIYQVQKDRSAEEAKTFLNKLRAYAITDQDRNYKGEGLEVSSHGWIYEQTGDDLLFIWDEAAWKGHNSIGKSNWGEYAKHIQGHGNLGSQYPKYKFGVEGDTPAFLYLMPNGLNDPVDPTQSSWGGNFVKKDGGLWREASTCASNFEQTYPAAFNNFAARMDWAKEGKGNRNPNLVLDGDAGLNVLRKTPGPGTSVTLDASKTTDPDGDNLQFKWWVQSDAGTYEGEIEIADSTSSAATIQIPADAAGRSFHVICEVTDDGTHNLSSYRRVVFQPTGDMVATTNQKNTSLADWLRTYIPDAYPGTDIVAHGGGAWFQAKLDEPKLIVSWADWKEEVLSLKDVEAHSLTEGESIFVDKTEASDWADHANVTFYDGVGYYIDGYEASAMSGWDVAKSTIIQFTGDSDTFVAEMAEAKAEGSFTAPVPKSVDKQSDDTKLADWLRSYIPEKHADAEVIAHGGGAWFQAKITEPNLIVSWADWKEEVLSLKDVEAHSLTEGESIFVDKTEASDWADHANVTFYDGVGYYIDGYEASAMSGWDVAKSTIIQFTGDSDTFVAEMAEAKADSSAAAPVVKSVNEQSDDTKLADWLRSYIPEKHADAEVIAHGGGAWFQAKITEPNLIVSWADWKEEVLSLKDVEAHSLTEGESIFVDKTEASDWADHANVTFYDGVGYYIDGYEASAMSGWDVAKSTIIQFTGESDTFVAEMAEAKADSSAAAPVVKSVNEQSDDTKLADWLRSYIPEKHADAEVIAHGGGAWFQAKITEPNLIVSWADWKEEVLSLKDVEAHSLTEGESIFVDKTEASDWADHANVTFYDGVGYYIDGYEASAMSGWDVAKSTIIQFTGDSDTFVAEMAEAKADNSAAAPKPAPAKERVSFKQWLFEYLPTQYPNAEMIDHTYWLQGKIGNGISVNWTEWTDNDSTLKAMEAHNLTAGKSMFIEQKGNKKQDWADNPNVTYYEGAGYYISGYDPATMGEWDGKGLSVIQFDGDSSDVAKTIAEGWSGDAKSTLVPSKASQTKEPSGEPSAGTPYSPFPSNVVVTKVKHFDNMCWKIAAAGGTWYFENGETGGKTGFSSAFDQAGNDWIGNDADRGYNKSSASGGRHEYRGWPNFGNGNFNHPQRSSGSKSWWVDASGNAVAFDEKLEGDHLIMRSSNAKYDVEYHFFPSHAAIKVLKAADKYAFLYEGPIGGEQDASVEKDFYVLKDGKHRKCKEGGLGYLESEFGNKFPSPFFYLEDSDPKDTQVWYAGVKNAGPESAGDEGWRQGSNMVIFSFGRDEDKRAYTGTDAVCVFGFQPKGSHEHIASFIESRLESPFAAPSAKANPAPANAGASSASGSTYTKPRMIVTTDLGADPDDEQSLVRMLVCANEFDIEGLVVSTGCWKKKQSNTNMLDKIVDAYGECYDNLKVHAEGFPTPEYLRSISVMGQLGYGMSDVGDGKDSLGSDMIIASADRDDPRPIWVGGWGGTNNVAQAIWTVSKTRSKEDLEKFLAKLRVYDILGQDDAGAWIAKNYPQVFYIRATKVYGWQPPKNGDYQKNDIQSHGPLGALYPDTKWATEGDTPAYMHIYPTGLNDPDQIDQGGWGGRFSFKKKTGIKSMSGVKGEERKFDPYEMWGNTSDGTGAIKRWSKGYNNDFAARMDWSITSKFSEANHHPVAILNGDTTRDVLELSVASGESVSLSAAGTDDPDNDSLTYSWSIYEEPATYKGAVAIDGPSDPTARISVPADASGKNIHVILEVHDDGTPNLYAYRRMILNVK